MSAIGKPIDWDNVPETAPAIFTFHTDPGHGWLEVTAADLAAVGLKATDFSRYSFRNEYAYFLEEDCDASKFVEAWRAKHGRTPEFRDAHQERTFIRNLRPIHSFGVNR